MTEGFARQTAWVRPQRILFGRTGLLAELGRRDLPPAAAFTAPQLRQQIDVYWVYAYLNGKYYKRQDIHKLFYVQNVLLQTHMRVLRAFRPTADWNWWARDIHALSAAQQTEFVAYFGASTPQAVAAALCTSSTSSRAMRRQPARPSAPPTPPRWSRACGNTCATWASDRGAAP